MTTELIAGPDAALLQAIRPSASLMAKDEELFVRLLHENIGNLVRNLPDGGWGFCERTARIVLWLTERDQPPETVAEALRWFAATNQAESFPLSEYVSVGHALVRVAREISGTDWTSATGSAWIRFFMWMQSHLRAGAHQAAVQAAQAAVQAAAQIAAQQEAARNQAAAAQAVAAQETVRSQAVAQEAAGSQAAATREAAHRETLDQPRRADAGAADLDAAAAASLLDHEDEDKSDPGYGPVMLA